MLAATWDCHGTLATWQDHRTIEVYHQPSGWACRLLEKGTTVKVAFPYDSHLDAQYEAERLATSTWGPLTATARG